jgi:AbrB family looped-hinge helix DNA binding protein
MSEVVKLHKSGKNLVITIPAEICEKLELNEGSEVEIEPFTCSGEPGARIKPKK